MSALRGAIFVCGDEHANCFACARESNAGAMFRQQMKPRGGAQAKIFDEKFLAAGDSRHFKTKIFKFWILTSWIQPVTMEKSVHTKEYAYFVERLKKARQESGLTQAEVAKKLGRPQSHISNVESGQQRVDVVELQRFAKIYNKEINYFIK